ncbi:MAG: glutathione-disulfide reductase, partial [Gammaproteobacteria bacterium]
MAEQFDLIVLGGGSGGLAAAQRAAEYGAKVAVVEKGRLGGTCVNVGCVPKKVMWHAADIAHAMHLAADYGFGERVPEHDWAELKQRRDAYVLRLNGIYERNLENKKVDYLAGEASLLDAQSVRVGDRDLNAPRIVIATGGEPAVPEVEGSEHGITSDGFFELKQRPQRVAVVGSGYIAVELGGVLRALGSDVSLFARKDAVLREFDTILQTSVVKAMQADGINLVFQSVPQAVRKTGDGLQLDTEDKKSHGPFDSVIWAIGRTPCTASLQLENAGVSTDAKGFITTDEYQETNVPGIFALGDVTGRVALTPVAIAAGRRLSDRLFGGQTERHLVYDNVPSVVFTHPPVGTVGLSEQEAVERYGADKVKVYTSNFVSLIYGVSE